MKHNPNLWISRPWSHMHWCNERQNNQNLIQQFLLLLTFCPQHGTEFSEIWDPTQNLNTFPK